MDRVIRIQTFTADQRDRWSRGYRWAAARPSWVTRFALLTFLFVVAFPLALLIGLAVLAAVVVFGGLAFLSAAVNSVRRLFRGDGRSNVRVIERSRDEGT